MCLDLNCILHLLNDHIPNTCVSLELICLAKIYVWTQESWKKSKRVKKQIRKTEVCVLLEVNVLKGLFTFYLKGHATRREGGRDKEREKDLPCAGSLRQWLYWPELRTLVAHTWDASSVRLWLPPLCHSSDPRPVFIYKNWDSLRLSLLVKIKWRIEIHWFECVCVWVCVLVVLVEMIFLSVPNCLWNSQNQLAPRV